MNGARYNRRWRNLASGWGPPRIFGEPAVSSTSMRFNPGRSNGMGGLPMRWNSNLLMPVAALALCATGLAQTRHYNLGRAATPEEIRSYGVLVGPSGKELPPGSGTASEGSAIYAQKCASCHGKNGEGTKVAPD